MTWEYEYDADADTTTIYWNGTEQGTVSGKINRWKGRYPLREARQVVRNAIQSAGTPERIAMQYDLNYGFEEIETTQ